MAVQPINNTLDYENFFSNELNNFISQSIHKLVIDLHFPQITPNVFTLGIMEDNDCMAYKVLNTYLTSVKIQELYDALFINIQDESLSTIRPGREINFSSDMKSVLSKANQERIALGHNMITTDHVLLAILNNKTIGKNIIDLFNDEMVTYDIIKNNSIKIHETISEIFEPQNVKVINLNDDNNDDPITNSIRTALNLNNPKQKKLSSVQLCANLNSLVEMGKIDNIIGRETEINNIIKIFNRRKCNNVLLVGDSGVGKTAIVEGLAKMIVNGTIPDNLADYEIYSFNASNAIAGTQFRGMYEGKINNMINDLKSVNKAILFIDNIHAILMNEQRSDMDFGSIIENILNDCNIKIIAATTPKAYHKTFENNSSLANKFQKIIVEKPSINDSINILNGIKKYYEQFHNVSYDDEIIKSCVNLANRYITDKPLPMSAIDLMDEVGAYKKISNISNKNIILKKERLSQLKEEKDSLIKQDKINEANNIQYQIDGINNEIAQFKNIIENNKISLNDLYQTVSEHTNIPVSKLNVSEKKALANINDILKKSIIGQDDAINKVCQAIKRSKVGLYPKNRPIFSGFFIGNSGCGKTLLAKQLAKEIFGDEKFLVKLDMSEYSDKTAVNKLIGSSAGYVGYSEGGILTEAIKNKKHAVLLIDEFEKADEEIYNLFLQILDEGILTDNTGQKVDFKNTIIIMTSNVGTKKAFNEKGIGFFIDEEANKNDIIEKELKNKFPPEFINRIDEIVYFNNLSDENLKNIVKLELNKLNERLNENNFKLNYNDDTVNFIFNQINDKKEFGARPITRIIQNEIENKITDLILNNGYENYTFNTNIVDNKLNIY